MRAECKVVNSCERTVPVLSRSIKEDGVKLRLFWIVTCYLAQARSDVFRLHCTKTVENLSASVKELSLHSLPHRCPFHPPNAFCVPSATRNSPLHLPVPQLPQPPWVLWPSRPPAPRSQSCVPEHFNGKGTRATVVRKSRKLSNLHCEQNLRSSPFST